MTVTAYKQYICKCTGHRKEFAGKPESFRPGLALGLTQEIILFNSRLEKSDTILINVLETQFNKFLFSLQ